MIVTRGESTAGWSRRGRGLPSLQGKKAGFSLLLTPKELPRPRPLGSQSWRWDRRRRIEGTLEEAAPAEP
jgi:hypothetical protein